MQLLEGGSSVSPANMGKESPNVYQGHDSHLNCKHHTVRGPENKIWEEKLKMS